MSNLPHLRTVDQVVRRFLPSLPRWIDKDDLIQEIYCGLYARLHEQWDIAPVKVVKMYSKYAIIDALRSVRHTRRNRPATNGAFVASLRESEARSFQPEIDEEGLWRSGFPARENPEEEVLRKEIVALLPTLLTAREYRTIQAVFRGALQKESGISDSNASQAMTSARKKIYKLRDGEIEEKRR